MATHETSHALSASTRPATVKEIPDLVTLYFSENVASHMRAAYAISQDDSKNTGTVTLAPYEDRLNGVSKPQRDVRVCPCGPTSKRKALGFYVYLHQPTGRLFGATSTIPLNRSDTFSLMLVDRSDEQAVVSLPKRELLLLATSDGYITADGRDYLSMRRLNPKVDSLLSCIRSPE